MHRIAFFGGYGAVKRGNVWSILQKISSLRYSAGQTLPNVLSQNVVALQARVGAHPCAVHLFAHPRQDPSAGTPTEIT